MLEPDARDRIAELTAANETLREFVAVAAHELRGPMAAILGYGVTMTKRWGDLADEDKQEFLGIIVRRSRYLTRLLDSLLTLSKIEAGAVDVLAEPVSVADALKHALEDVEDRSEVAVDCPDDLRVQADPDHLQRILVNFVRNATRYGAPPIEIEARGDGEAVAITVRDHGTGIAETVVDRIFEPFVRATTDDPEKGTGLGLSIVRGLARAGGGDVWYEPNEPTGACFGVRLPVA